MDLLQCWPLCVILLSILLALFSSDIENQYPASLRNLLEEPLFKFVVLIAITFVAYKHFCCGVLLGLIFVFSVTNTSSMSQVNEGFENGSPVSHCSSYDGDQISRVGTAYYPLHDNSRVEEVRGSNKKDMDQF